MDQLNFNRVTYDGELADFSEDDLRELIREFENAQESNVAEFEDAADALDEIDEADIAEFTDARSTLVDEITDHENFDEVPLSENQLESCDFSDLREWRDFVADFATTEEDEDEDETTNFGQKSPTHTEDDGPDASDFGLDSMRGVNFD